MFSTNHWLIRNDTNSVVNLLTHYCHAGISPTNAAAALRQYLRDRSEFMTQEEIDNVLDLIAKILEALNEDKQ
ncbi:hypothetical protein GCM10010967_22740 [Dyadobacter beijingensis]|uniref:Uncharacterized protein n=1 Tax=Dyadobacter beijingensis TaxID=365489 RepID=A0ABQ2HTH0_9BACT|nr:hypothetical protein GCM10010967_22740 [Dyadobacter beijingensis]